MFFKDKQSKVTLFLSNQSVNSHNLRENFTLCKKMKFLEDLSRFLDFFKIKINNKSEFLFYFFNIFLLGITKSPAFLQFAIKRPRLVNRKLDTKSYWDTFYFN